VLSAVFFNLGGLISSGGNDGAAVPAFHQFTVQFNGAPLDPPLVQFRKYLDNVHGGKLAGFSRMIDSRIIFLWLWGNKVSRTIHSKIIF
jgi:hypothetical protein